MKLTKILKFVFQGKPVEDARSITAELFADLDAYYTTLIDKEADKTIRHHLRAKRKLLKDCEYEPSKVEKDFRELDEDEVEIYNILVDQDSSVEDLAFKLYKIKIRMGTSSIFKGKAMMARQHSKHNGCRFMELGEFLLTPKASELRAQWKKAAESGN